ncbi:MAG: hypothetical protein ACI4VH_00470 [Clostridia bacterium]
MENASKALLMAAGVLIGMLILSLAVFLFMDFGATSKGIYSEVESNQLTQYNAQYTVYSGREDITIYEIVSVINLAKQNNTDYKDYTNFENEYKVLVSVQGTEYTDKTSSDIQILLEKYNGITGNGELEKTFLCKEISYHDNGRVNMIKFQ